MTALSRIGLIAFDKKPDIAVMLAEVALDPIFKDISFYGLRGTLPFPQLGIPRLELKRFLRTVNAIVCFGGDGSFLSAARIVAGKNIPLIGVKLGGLGFLTDVPPKRVKQALRDVFGGKYRSEKRTMFDVFLRRHGRKKDAREVCLNDAVIKREGSRLLNLSVFRGRELVSEYHSDGLILATPTGSTAYSMAAGGPIVHPALDCIVLTPICSHSLTQKPIVCPILEPFSVVLENLAGGASLSVDGKTQFSLGPGDRVEVRRSKQVTSLLTSVSTTYFGILREKLHWGQK